MDNILSKPWYKDKDAVRVYVHVYFKKNFHTSLRDLSRELGVEKNKLARVLYTLSNDGVRQERDNGGTRIYMIDNKIPSVSRQLRDKSGTDKVPPSWEDWLAFFKENGFEGVAKRAWDYYTDLGWRDSRGKKIFSWKGKARVVWFTDQNKIPQVIRYV